MNDPTIPDLFTMMPERYKASSHTATRWYYFSIGPHKYTVCMSPAGCDVQSGKTRDNCDLVLKTTEKLFIKMVVHGKLPGALDIARGRIKTNDPVALRALKGAFDFTHQ